MTTWNPSDAGTELSFTNGNLTAVGSGAGSWASPTVRSTTAKTSGKWYFEIALTTLSNSAYIIPGIADKTTGNPTTYLGTFANSSGANEGNAIYVDGITLNYATALPNFVQGDVFGFALDMGAAVLYLSRNGTYFNSGNPSGGTGYVISALPATVYAGVSIYAASNTATANFGPTGFSTSPPTGFLPWDVAPFDMNSQSLFMLPREQLKAIGKSFTGWTRKWQQRKSGLLEPAWSF